MAKTKTRKKKPKESKQEQANGTGNTPETEITKKEGIRREMAERCEDAKPPALQEYVKEPFNLDIDRNSISANKSAIIKGGRPGRRASMRNKAAGRSGLLRKPGGKRAAEGTTASR